MRELKERGRVRSLGVAGECEALMPHVQAGAFDALITPFNIHSGWRERHMVRIAMERQMAVIGVEPCPVDTGPVADAAKIKPRPHWFARRNPLAGVGTYAFLSKTPGWSAEQMCLGYALTEPSLASVQVVVEDGEHLSSLAEVTERDLPAAASAQIEMARFSAEQSTGSERRSARRTA
jgi:aryl-alcohol dehydrogenase-like predicted oxidoreductase